MHINDNINDNKYFPKKLLKFNLSFFINEFRNLTETWTAKKLINKYMNILSITTGNIYRKDANTPFIWYFNIILDNVTPNVNPLKNNINITTSTPIIEIPRAKINSNCK